jgi:hypothetical protein
LEEAKRRLKQLESDITSRQEQALAEIAVLRETRNKSMIDVQREKARIAQTKLLSPMTGLVAIRQNRGQGFFFPGMQLPDIREGDTLQPGMPVADVLDLSEFEIVARVGELDRANLHEGQDVSIQLDAVPDKRFRGKVKTMSGSASANIFSGDPGKKFDVVFSIDMKQLLTTLGAKPEDIQRIMETAERNSKKAPPASAQPMMAGPGGPGGPVPAGGAGQPVRVVMQPPPGARQPAASSTKTPAIQATKLQPLWISRKRLGHFRRRPVLRKNARAPSCLRRPKRIHSCRCCSVRVCLPMWKSQLKRFPMQSIFPHRRFSKKMASHRFGWSRAIDSSNGPSNSRDAVKTSW